MKCNDCPAFGRDFISQLCVLRHDISKGHCKRQSKTVLRELEVFLQTDSRAVNGAYDLPNYTTHQMKGEAE